MPESWENLPTDIHPGDPWLVYTSPGQIVRATVQRLVGGHSQCRDSIGVLLNVAPQDLKAFAVSRARYFIAHRGSISEAPSQATTPVRSLESSELSDGVRRSVEAELAALLARELPRVRAEAMPSLKRALDMDHYDRVWARERLNIEAARGA